MDSEINIQRDIIDKDDHFVEVYGEKYIQKIEYLMDVLLKQETGENIFKVLDFEAGLGKSRYTDIIIREYRWRMGKRRFLIVKRFNEESYNSEEIIKDVPFLEGHVEVITSETWNEKWKNKIDDLIDIRILIISHKRYLDLCLNPDMREIFSKNRHTLVIDEKVNFPIYTYSDSFYSKVRGLIHQGNRHLFDKTCDTLQQLVKDTEHKTLVQKVMPEIDEDLLWQFEEVMLGEIHISNGKERRDLQLFLDTILLCHDKDVLKVMNSQKIDCPNRHHSYWGLKNNIILDASASIDGVYKSNPDKYILQRQTPFVDHSRSEFIHIKVNGSKSFIKHNQKEYFEHMLKHIDERHKENEKTLLVIHKNFANDLYRLLKKKYGDSEVWRDKEDKEFDSDYDNQSFAVSWFGNLIGKNTFKDFDNVWILGSPNIPQSNYLVQYMQYTGQSLGKKGLKVYQGKFKNDTFRSIQEGYIASEIYQSLKRIQRNPNPKGKFYIVHNDDDIMQKVLSQMKGSKINETITIEFEKDKSIKPTSKIDIIADYLNGLVKDSQSQTKIKKSDVAKKYGTIRWDRVKKHPIVRELMHSNRLSEKDKYFLIL